MKNAESLQTDVLDELAWDPQVDSSDIAVTVHDNIVTLAGHTATYMEKLAAEKAARRVKGVKAVVDDIDVDDTLYLTDDGGHMVRKCTTEGKVLLELGTPEVDGLGIARKIRRSTWACRKARWCSSPPTPRT